jgi:hypothetical protein
LRQRDDRLRADLALHLIGKDDVALYDGSWAEWGADPALPKETGPVPRSAPPPRPRLKDPPVVSDPSRRPAIPQAGAGRPPPEWTGTGDHPSAVVSPPVWRASTHLYPDMARCARACA